MKDTGVIEASPTNNKLYRRIDKTAIRIDFKSAKIRIPLDVRYPAPFHFERYVRTFPGNIIVVAGASDAGKTSFLLNLVKENMKRFNIYYFSSEMGDVELAERLSNFKGIGLDDWTFECERRSSNFADVIRPDDFNIIDFMELDRDLFLVAEYIRAIHDKLRNGICVIAIQKNPNSEIGRGGYFGMEKARLYLSMDRGRTKIAKAKNWVTPTLNPYGLCIEYKITGGCKYTLTKDWYDPDNPTRDVKPRFTPEIDAEGMNADELAEIDF